MKSKDIVTLVLLLVGIVVVFTVVQKSGILGAFGSLISPGMRPVGGTSVPGDVMTGPNTGASSVGGAQFGPASSPVVNSVGVSTAPDAAAPAKPDSGATAPHIARGTIGPDIAKVIDANTVSVTLPGVPSASTIGIGGGVFAGKPQDFLASLVAPTVAPATPGGAPGGGLYFGPNNVNAPGPTYSPATGWNSPGGLAPNADR